jgi:DNA-directed RNA polymerase specialized sigma24 family protein
MTSARRVATDDGPEAVADVGELFDQYAPQLWRYCARRIGPDLAEDVVGEVFLVVARNPDRIAAGESVRAWLYGIAINQLRSRRRAELRALRALERTGVDPLGGATGVVEGHETRSTERADAARLACRIAGGLARLPAGHARRSDRYEATVDGRPVRVVAQALGEWMPAYADELYVDPSLSRFIGTGITQIATSPARPPCGPVSGTSNPAPPATETMQPTGPPSTTGIHKTGWPSMTAAPLGTGTPLATESAAATWAPRPTPTCSLMVIPLAEPVRMAVTLWEQTLVTP